MYYPEKLPLSRHYKWLFHEARQKNAELVKSYYDHIDDILSMHIHDFYEINIITSGCGRHYVADRNVPTDVGDVFVIPPNVPHGYCGSNGFTVYHILLSNEFSMKYFGDLKKLNGFKMLFEIEPILRLNTDKSFYLTLDQTAFNKIKNLIGEIESENAATGFDSDLRRGFHTLSLIGTLCEMISHKSLTAPDDNTERHVISIVKSLETIENNYNKKLSFKALAENCKISYSTYLRMFKSLTGLTPIQYQTACRIKNAEHLLKTTDETVLSIALSCGFYDSAHFIREFKALLGASPTAYRSNQILFSSPKA